MSATGTYAQIDDHEVKNDFDGETVDPDRYAAGLEAFNDWMPTNRANVLTMRRVRAATRGTSTRSGERRQRSSTRRALVPQLARSGEGGVHEPGHTADPRPRADSAQRHCGRSAGLPASPPAGCLTAINGPLRTLLGPVQKAAFKADLLASTAKFKIVLSEDAIQQFYALPYDRWEGYGGERSEILNYIRSE